MKTILFSRAQLVLVSACALLFVWKPDCGDLTVLDNVTFNTTASNGEIKDNAVSADGIL